MLLLSLSEDRGFRTKQVPLRKLPLVVCQDILPKGALMKSTAAVCRLPKISTLGLAASCLLLFILTGCQWSMYRQGQTRSGRSGIDTSSNTGTLQWSLNLGWGQNQFPFGPLIGFTPSNSSGGIFMGDLYGNLYSISTNGTVAWSISLPGGIAATPNAIGVDGTVYAAQSGGSLFAVGSDGVLKWTYSPPGKLSRTDLNIATDGTIYTGNQCGVFYALNPDGTVKWTFSAFQRDCSFYTTLISPAIGSDGTIYGGVDYGYNQGGVLFALSSSGTLLWQSTTFVGTPTVASSGDLYVLSLDREHLFVLNSAGVLQWQVDAPYQQEFTLPAIGWDNTAYLGTAGAGLWAIDYTGVIKWKANPGGNMYFFAPPTIGGDGTIYIAYTSLLAVNPDSSLKWSTNLCSGIGGYAGIDEPVIGGDGTIYMILDGPGTQGPCPLQAFH
jgi:outer membrane protein assembly factor BamB